MKMYDLVTYYIQKPERIYIAPSRLFEIYNKSDLVAELSDHILDKSYTAALAVADVFLCHRNTEFFCEAEQTQITFHIPFIRYL